MVAWCFGFAVDRDGSSWQWVGRRGLGLRVQMFGLVESPVGSITTERADVSEIKFLIDIRCNQGHDEGEGVGVECAKAMAVLHIGAAKLVGPIGTVLKLLGLWCEMLGLTEN
ncbi:hypothetical protein Tco_0696853 [Tanacetum coccineum]